MKVAQLQGTPWHTDQLYKTCNDGSKYCIYNHKICSCVAIEPLMAKATGVLDILHIKKHLVF